MLNVLYDYSVQSWLMVALKINILVIFSAFGTSTVGKHWLENKNGYHWRRMQMAVVIVRGISIIKKIFVQNKQQKQYAIDIAIS